MLRRWAITIMRADQVLAGVDCDIQEAEGVLRRAKSMLEYIVTCRCEELLVTGPLPSHSAATHR